MRKIGMRLTAPLAVLCLLMGGIKPLDAQTVTPAGTADTKISVYRGTVIDDEGEPLPGVSITVPG